MERIPSFVKAENPFCSIKNNLYVVFSKSTSFGLEWSVFYDDLTFDMTIL